MNKKYLFISIPVIVLLITGLLIFNNEDKNKALAIQTNITNVSVNISISNVLEDIPVAHENFTLIRRNFYDNQIRDLTKLSKNVYKRPEFYPTWESNGIRWYINHDFSRFGVHGYGTFPSEIHYTIANMSKEDSMEIYTFFHTSWGVETWQGVKLNPIYNQTLFDVEITPNTILLEPTFPKVYYNWTDLIKINVKAKQQIPVGNYAFSFYISSPSETQNEEWSWYVLDKYTNNRYHDEINECKKQESIKSRCDEIITLIQNKYVAGGQFSPSNLFTAIVEVTE